MMTKLGVNIDHIAVLREARAIHDPNPIDALPILKLTGTDQVTVHLREDRRHIHDDDLKQIINQSPIPVNLECSINEEMITIACELKPARVTLVPENREEVTTEGGLDVLKHYETIHHVTAELFAAGIDVSLFIDPDPKVIRAAKGMGIKIVEIHTGEYANIHAMLNSNLSRMHHSIKELELHPRRLQEMLDRSIQRIKDTVDECDEFGIQAAAGHGLNYHNVQTIAAIDGIFELNIGQSIIARSLFTGLERAIKDMQELIA
jgi:pyridoxine 5-phosphate synthase